MEANRKRAKVHRLPTEIKAKDWRQQIVVLKDTSFAKDGIGLSVNNTENHQDKTEILSLLDATCIPQHLYFTTDEEIKEGDWYISAKNTLCNRPPKEYLDLDLDTGKKIIASTDPKLFKDGDAGIIDHAFKEGMLNIPQSFIEEYCKSGGIDEVDVEYFADWDDLQYSEFGEYAPRKLKVDPIHNTITTHLIEEKMYSASEVVKMFWDCHNGVLDEFQLKWIKENL